jgi:hypothetical protein
MRLPLCLITLLFATSVLAQTPVPAALPTTGPSPQSAPTEEPIELNTVMMESTFLLESPAPQGKTLGTVFLIAVPIPNTEPVRGVLVLVTAAHVLEEMPGDFAILHLRRKTDEKTNAWAQAPFQLRIRSNGVPLWKKHPMADVAAMYIDIPPDTPIKPITTRMFISDDELLKYEINPGDEVHCLGYPLGVASNDAGFPILRSGKIASYPLTPTDQTKSFLLDLRVFKGNSGGPVFFVEKYRPDFTGFGKFTNFHFIMGLIAQELLYTEASVGQYSQEIHQTQLGLAQVVHASLIKQTIEMLPPPLAK